MDNKHTRSLEKSVIDLLQYSVLDIEDAIKLTFETILKAEQSDFLDYSEYDKGNKKNGYRSKLVQGFNRAFRIDLPRDRLGNFKPFFLDLIKQERENLDELAFTLYSKGLTTRDIEGVFTKIYGQNYSKSSVSRLSTEFIEERRNWQERELYPDYYSVYIDALWLPISRGTVSREAFYVIIGLRDDLTRDVLAVWTLPSETASGWEEMLQDIKSRGVKHVVNITADGLPGIKEAIRKVFPRSNFQRCIVHKQRNILNRIRSTDKKEVANDLKKLFTLTEPDDTINKAKTRVESFLMKWSKSYPRLDKLFKDNEIVDFFTYVKYPYEFRKMTYTTNWIESLNKRIRRTTKIRNSFPNEDSALNLVCAALIDITENNYYKYKVTTLEPVKEELKELLDNIKK